MSVAPNAGVVDLDTFLPPTGAADGVQGQVPKPLVGQAGYVLTGNGWASAGSIGLVGYQGTWNALTNTPTLTSSVGTQGYYYVVNVAGTTNLNGITDWQVGDWAIFNGSTWQKVDNTDSYDPANVAITGGTIDNTTIGNTTPAAGTFTTLTAQNETLKGTGQNLILRSQQFSNAVYSSSSATRTDNQTTAPDGTSTGALIQATAASYGGLVRQFNAPYLPNTTYTISVYAKAGTSNFVGLRATNGCVSPSDSYCYFNLATGIATAIIPVSGTVVSVGMTNAGNGWYRCSVIYTTGATISNNLSDFTITTSTGGTNPVYAGTETIYAWGFQVELGNTLNTYIPTTATAVYGTPTLSFSGVAGVGLQSDGSLYVQPAGTGALQAQATTSTATGGNARGANAVDLQTARGGASAVASGANSFIGGGYSNTASNSIATVGGGQFNIASGVLSSITGGYANTASGYFSGIGAGTTNTAAGILNFIGGGQLNSGTSGSIVTTQSATMNGTTAVTLAASNASIKVGQLVSGTYLGFPNYVAAISGTSLTLATAASGSGTATLSFYTPHGVVVGGGNNTATGAYSFIGGGGDAGTAGNRNVASGDWSTVAGGIRNSASGLGSFIGGGGTDGTTALGNVANTTSASVIGGANNIASGVYSVTGGRDNTADGNRSTAWGSNAWTRSIRGIIALSACQSPIGAAGVSQSCLLIIAKQTTDATATVLTSNGGAASSDNQVILPNNSAYYFKGSVIANVTGAANGAAWSFEGAIMRGANAASTVLIGTVTLNRIAATAGASLWTVAITADTTNGGLAVTVTGSASTTIRWVAKLETTEVTF